MLAQQLKHLTTPSLSVLIKFIFIANDNVGIQQLRQRFDWRQVDDYTIS